MKRAWIFVAAVIGLFLLADWILHRDAGLTRTVMLRGSLDVLDARRVQTLDLHDLNSVPLHPNGITVRWDGAWNVPSTGLYDLVVESRGRSAWRIDGHLAHEVATADQSGASRTVWLAAGFHQIEITYDPDPAAPQFVVAAMAAPLSPRALKPRLPRNPRLRAAGSMLRSALGVLLIVAVVMAIRRSSPTVMNLWRRRFVDPAARLPRLGRPIAWTLLAVILLYGAVLRIDAIAAAYGPVTSPRWLAALQTRTVVPPEALRPSGVVWQPAPLYPHADGPPTHYSSDPYVYLKAGREMQSFYAAHFREPVFPFAIKIFLRLLNGQDVAVSFASTAFAVLAVWFTYILGAAVWSRPVGLAAALGLALDIDDILLASAGWRDDAFIATVPLAAYLMLRCWRAGNAPVRMWRVGRLSFDAAYVDALILGIVAGLAILVRFMAISFVVAGAAWLLLTMRSTWRRRVTIVGITVATAIVISAPYFINCWRVYGDPLYTFNVHGSIYNFAEGKGETNQGTAAYIVSKFRSSPVEMTDTIARGLTTYPFNNKWQGLDRWVAGIRDWARIAAAAGLVLLAASAPGRLMLVVMIASLVPFSFTWGVDPNWRFTAHVYPALLIAAAVTVSSAFRGLRAALALRPNRADAPVAGNRRVRWLAWIAAAGVVLVSVWAISLGLPRKLFLENLRRHGVATVAAGTRDLAFLDRGWSDITGTGNVRMRIAITDGVLSIPLPSTDDYDLMLRMDPFPRPLHDRFERFPVLNVSLNGTPVATVALRWDPERVGVYEVRLPRALTRRGDNRLSLQLQRQDASTDVPQAGLSDGAAFGLWYVRVQPASVKAGAGQPRPQSSP